MDLHELLDAATADLPDVPDLVPEALRVHRRRTLLMRTGMISATAALAVGAGTLTIAAPWHHSAAATTAVAAASGSAASGFDRFPPGHRQAAPRLSGTTLAGKPYSTSYTGRVTVINVWGSWCTPCREEASSFAATAKKDAGEGVQFVGIDIRDNDAAAQSYVSHFGITYPSLSDPDEALVHDLMKIGPADGVPFTIVVDADGKVAVRAIGDLTRAQLAAAIAYAQTA